MHCSQTLLTSTYDDDLGTRSTMLCGRRGGHGHFTLQHRDIMNGTDKA